MAQQYDNTDRGVLFKNEDKETDQHPDYKGRINAEGTDYWLSAWIKTAKDGRKFMSLSVKPMEQKAAPKRQAGQTKGGNAFDQMADDIPF